MSDSLDIRYLSDVNLPGRPVYQPLYALHPSYDLTPTYIRLFRALNIAQRSSDLSANKMAMKSFVFLGVAVGGFLYARASPVIEARQASLPSGWSSLGCYSDSTTARTIRVASYTDVTGMTIESCLAFCTPGGYRYAGVEFARVRQRVQPTPAPQNTDTSVSGMLGKVLTDCDNVIESPGAPISSSSCNMACTGDASEICGGANAINVFQNSASTTSPTTTTTTTAAPTATPTIVQQTGTFQYVGCYQYVSSHHVPFLLVLTPVQISRDGVSGLPRSLIHQLSVPGGVTAASCTAACKAAGYTLAGLEYAQECWCDSYMPLATVSPDTDCNMPCAADGTALCGAGNRLAVYVDTTAPALDLNTCLNSVQLQSTNPPIFNFDLEGRYIPAFPGAPVSVSAPLANFPKQGNPNFQILASRSSTQPHTYSIASGGGLTAVIANPFPGYQQGSWALEPVPGTIFEFEVDLTGVPSNLIGSHFCAQVKNILFSVPT
ncbi:hypothetical protein CVT26_001701 [Gymnopilus dilepis]|uniref:WSC domain-containing protein n=1 Tax=Gymnopilus dilepis TaxID=231916 RepID=A0A409YXD9_9AGAR|nr:hypothetical protein CVT26_001701 [Gymnopilus dilepis]